MRTITFEAENSVGWGLYIHFPFCLAKCPYCAFYSEIYQEPLVSSYLVALPQEVGLLPNLPAQPETIYLGGGTPSLIPLPELEALLKALPFDLSRVKEFTIEANPATIDAESLEGYKLLGINRISLGVQSLQPDELKFLGRIHTPEEAIKSLELIFKAGYNNVSADIIYGIPSQTPRSFRETVVKLLKDFPLTHLSVYLLSYEEGTPLYRRLKEGRIKRMSEAEEEELYHLARELTGIWGLEQYEVSSFARPGYACKHNICYWRGKPYIGLGPSAHSFLPQFNLRWGNIRDVKAYIQLVSRGKRPVEYEERLGGRERLEEFIMLGLRMIEGISIELLEAKFGRDINSLIPKYLITNGFLKVEDGRVKISPDKMFISDEIVSEIIKGI